MDNTGRAVEEILKEYRSVLKSLIVSSLRAIALFPLAAGAVITSKAEILLRTADRIESRRQEVHERITKPVTEIILPSPVLYSCYSILIRYGDRGVEGIVLVCAWENDGKLVASDVLFVEHSDFSPVSAELDNESLGDTVRYMRLCKYRPAGVAHIHPWDSNDVHTSEKDIRTQKRWEKVFGEVVGIVFSNSGVLRIFTADAKPEIRVAGEGVEKIGRNLYRLSSANEVRKWVRGK